MDVLSISFKNVWKLSGLWSYQKIDFLIFLPVWCWGPFICSCQPAFVQPSINYWQRTPRISDIYKNAGLSLCQTQVKQSQNTITHTLGHVMWVWITTLHLWGININIWGCNVPVGLKWLSCLHQFATKYANPN